MRSAQALVDPRRGALTACALAMMCAVALAMPSVADAAQDDSIPGVPLTNDFEGHVDIAGDMFDTYRIYILPGESLQITLTEVDAAASNLDLFIMPPWAEDFSTPAAWASTDPFNPVEVLAPPAAAIANEGWYYVAVRATAGAGSYRLQTTTGWFAPPPTATPERVWGSDRYTTAVAIALKNFPGWFNCDHVIIASGEDRAAADPLSAAGLSWTYGAPVLLVSSDRVPPQVINAMMGMAMANGPITAHVVGGPVSIPEARLAEISRAMPGGVTFDRVTPARDRYELASTIAIRMAQERGMDRLAHPFHSGIALIANGADPDKFFDALALSPIAAKTGYPILLVEQDRVPAATWHALNTLGYSGRLVGGGPATVSDGVVAQLDAGAGNESGRWAGDDRYSTASNIAHIASIARWLKPSNVAVTAKLPDALTGGTFAGLRGSPVLITPSDHLDASPRRYLHDLTDSVGECYTLGGPVSVTEPTRAQIEAALQP